MNIFAKKFSKSIVLHMEHIHTDHKILFTKSDFHIHEVFFSLKCKELAGSIIQVPIKLVLFIFQETVSMLSADFCVTTTTVRRNSGPYIENASIKKMKKRCSIPRLILMSAIYSKNILF